MLLFNKYNVTEPRISTTIRGRVSEETDSSELEAVDVTDENNP